MSWFERAWREGKRERVLFFVFSTRRSRAGDREQFFYVLAAAACFLSFTRNFVLELFFLFRCIARLRQSDSYYLLLSNLFSLPLSSKSKPSPPSRFQKKTPQLLLLQERRLHPHPVLVQRLRGSALGPAPLRRLAPESLQPDLHRMPRCRRGFVGTRRRAGARSSSCRGEQRAALS